MLFFSGPLFALAQADSAGAEGRNKVLVCHYQEDEGTWKAIVVGAPAVEGHLKNHDDALVGGTTRITGTQLDSSCQPTLDSCGNCLTDHGGLGCESDACEAAVCAQDPFCCDIAWDGICAGEAAEICPGTFCSAAQ